MNQTVGFIGLGVMGAGMAANILKAGMALIVHTSSDKKAETFTEMGATVAATPAELASKADIVVTCVPDAAALKSVVDGENGLAAASWPNGLLVDCSTIAPSDVKAVAAQIAACGAGMVDAPVSGGRKGADEGTLTIMCGGSDNDIARSQPVLQAMGSVVRHVGPLGAGQALKACNQLMVAVNLMGVCEAIALARSAGVDPHLMREILSSGAARSGVLEAHALRYLDGQMQAGFRADLMKKDLGIAADIGMESRRVQPATALALQMMTSLCNVGHNALDSSALGLLYDRLNGTETGR